MKIALLFLKLLFIFMGGIASDSLAANTVCAYTGNYTYNYTVSGVNGSTSISASGPTDRLSSSKSGYTWYYTKMLQPYTFQGGVVTVPLYEGVNLTFKPIIGNWNTTKMDGWNTYKANRKLTCGNVYWGSTDWKNILGNISVTIDYDSVLGSYVNFNNIPIMAVYAALTEENSEPDSMPSLPTATIYLNGGVTINGQCTTSPSSLEFDFGQISSTEALTRRLQKTVTINCSNAITAQVYMGGNRTDVGNRYEINTGRDEVKFFIDINRNDFSSNYTKSGGVELEAGMLFPSGVVPEGNYTGSTWMDLRVD